MKQSKADVSRLRIIEWIIGGTYADAVRAITPRTDASRIVDRIPHLLALLRLVAAGAPDLPEMFRQVTIATDPTP